MELVEEMTQRLKALSPSLGGKKVTQILAKEGLHLALSTVKRMLRGAAKPPKDGKGKKQRALPGGAAAEAEVLRRITSKQPGHIWLCDIFWGCPAPAHPRRASCEM